MTVNDGVHASAVAQLAQRDNVRAAVARLRAGRSYAWFTIRQSVALATFIAALVWIFLQPAPWSATGPESSAVAMYTLVVPMLLSTALVRGAQERFRLRERPSALQLVACGVMLFLLIVTIVYAVWSGLARSNDPNGSNVGGFTEIIVPIVIAAGFGCGTVLVIATPALRKLQRENLHRDESVPRGRVSVSARIGTVLIGLPIALVIATASLELERYVGAMGAFLLTLVLALPATTGWSAANVGLEWRNVHWVVFAGASGTAIVMAVLMCLVVMPAVVFVTVAATIVVAFIVTALIPARGVGK